MNFKIQNYFEAITIALICLLSFVFSYPIHFEDALTLEKVSEFGIEIPLLRIVFEPILGLLLFFNRSLYALQELPFVLLWILVFFLLVSIINYFKLNPLERKNFIVKQIAKTPILLGLWFVFFVIVIFVPLPNNKIVNHSKDYILVSTHAHTEHSHDGLISQKNMWEWQKKNGYDAFFITDHANHKKTYEFMQSQRQGAFDIDPLIMVGEEYSASNHMSLLGLKNKFSTRGLSDQQVVDSVHQYGGVVLINHWFDGKGKSLEYYRDLGVDGFEIENSGKEKYYDRSIHHQLKEFCKKNQLLMHGGLDYHGYGNASTLLNAFKIPGWHNLDPTAKENEILKIFKNGDQNKIQILMYKDRDFYKNEHLVFRPIQTFFNYFRTLNIFQVCSWILWILIFYVARKKVYSKPINWDKAMGVSSLMGAIFLLILGLNYVGRHQAISGFTEMYQEYSTLLFYSGSIFLIYSLGFIYFKFIRKSVNE